MRRLSFLLLLASLAAWHYPALAVEIDHFAIPAGGTAPALIRGNSQDAGEDPLSEPLRGLFHLEILGAAAGMPIDALPRYWGEDAPEIIERGGAFPVSTGVGVGFAASEQIHVSFIYGLHLARIVLRPAAGASPGFLSYFPSDTSLAFPMPLIPEGDHEWDLSLHQIGAQVRALYPMPHRWFMTWTLQLSRYFIGDSTFKPASWTGAVPLERSELTVRGSTRPGMALEMGASKMWKRVSLNLALGYRFAQVETVKIEGEVSQVPPEDPAAPDPPPLKVPKQAISGIYRADSPAFDISGLYLKASFSWHFDLIGIFQ